MTYQERALRLRRAMGQTTDLRLSYVEADALDRLQLRWPFVLSDFGQSRNELRAFESGPGAPRVVLAIALPDARSCEATKAFVGHASMLSVASAAPIFRQDGCAPATERCLVLIPNAVLSCLNRQASDPLTRRCATLGAN